MIGRLTALTAVMALIAITASAGPPPNRVQTVAGSLRAEAPTLKAEALRLALTAHRRAKDLGLLKKPNLLTIIDYSLASTEPRFWVFDVDQRKLLYHELVAHGMGTGENLATAFSNTHGSKQSSIGLFATDGTYYGRNGYSLYLHGLETGVNDQAYDRTIVMHGAWYVSDAFAKQHGRLGRSWGCPALDNLIAREVIELIKDGSAVFAYYPDEMWLQTSAFLNPEILEAGNLPPEELTLRSLPSMTSSDKN